MDEVDFESGYIEGWTDCQKYILRCPHKFGLMVRQKESEIGKQIGKLYCGLNPVAWIINRTK